MNLKKLEECGLSASDCGHTLSTHVEVSDSDLIERLLYGDLHGFRYIGETKTLATKFDSEKIMVKAIKATLEVNKILISRWTEDRCEKVIAVRAKFQNPIGYGIVKGTPFTNKYPMSTVVVILSLGYNGNEFNIITSYLEPNLMISEKIQRDRQEFMSNRKK